MPKRGPTDTDRPTNSPVDGDYEVVTAAGERKTAKLSQRVKEKVRDTLSMTDQLPTWQPGELADDADQTLVTGNPAVAPERVKYMDEKPHAFKGNPPRYCEVCNLPDRDPIHADDQDPPPKVMRELRRRRARDVEQRVGMAAAKVAGLVELDRWNRLYAIHIHHLASIAGLQAAAVEALQNRDLPTADLRALFRVELDEWERDIEAGGS
jgi:hypothetical protein